MTMAMTTASGTCDEGDFQAPKTKKQRERKQKPRNNAANHAKKTTNYSNNVQSTFGSSSWSKPKRATKPLKNAAQTQHNPAMTTDAHFSPNDTPVVEENAAADVSQEAIDHISSVVASEMDDSAATGNPEHVWNTTVASMAAVSLVASAFSCQDNLQTLASKQEKSMAETSTQTAQADPDQVNSIDDFRARCQKPLSQLMEEFGEEDPSWQTMQPNITTEETPQQTSNDGNNTTSGGQDKQHESDECVENLLGRQGKAPIHVEFTSYGYRNGAPPKLRNGWSHAQPLPNFECRDLPQVPGYLTWRDGVSGWVQRVLLSEPEVKKLAETIAQRALEAVEEAIQQGGHGYAAPLQMKVYVGSESGRHRSVVVCEQAAKFLRNLLRRSKNPRLLSVAISVGTHHRDVERAHKKNAQAKSERQKEAAEGDL